MSTYLLAFAVCDFDFVESFSANDVQVCVFVRVLIFDKNCGGSSSSSTCITCILLRQTRIYARDVAVINNATFYAKTITPLVLDYYEEYFDVKYPLPKSGNFLIFEPIRFVPDQYDFYWF